MRGRELVPREGPPLKALGYASSAIPEYWIVSLGHQHVEVLTEPTPADGYAVTTIVRSGVLRSTAVPALDVDLDALWAATSREYPSG